MSERETAGAGITLEALPDALQHLERLVLQKAGGRYAHAFAGISGGGDWSVSVSGGQGHRIDRSFRSPRLAGAIQAATEWLGRDELAELYGTLGLTPDGRLPVEARP